MFLLVQASIIESSQRELAESLTTSYRWGFTVIMAGLSFALLLTLFTAFFIGWRIVRPIGEMTKFTQQMKEGTCLADKVKTVKDLSEHRMFTDVNRQYT